MEFNYEDITLGDLDIELNYKNFEIICDGDAGKNGMVKIGVIDNEEINSKG